MNAKELNQLLNPVRMKIIMLFTQYGQMTTKDIQSKLVSVSQASLYRHMKALLKNGFIEVVNKTKIRGSVEITYQLKNNPFEELNKVGLENDLDTATEYFYTFAMTLIQDFIDYTQSEDANMQKDLIGFRTIPLYLSDQEHLDFIKEFQKLMTKYSQLDNTQNRLLRKFSFVYLPDKKEAK